MDSVLIFLFGQDRSAKLKADFQQDCQDFFVRTTFRMKVIPTNPPGSGNKQPKHISTPSKQSALYHLLPINFLSLIN